VPGKQLDASQIERIEVHAYMLAALLAEKNVVSSFGARFSVPFALASILVHGRSGLAAFDDSAVANQQVQALAQRVDLREEPSFTARYPEEQPVALRIVMCDGAEYSGKCTVTKGEPTNPHTQQELAAKFFELGEPVWGSEVTRKLHDGLMKLEDVGDFQAFADEFTL
ncbi:MAG TPA: hypothetical protein VFI62_02680, partial [Burkholderiales bacterium]|nr:hypothetical protein [Burkholderiales bacterium]